MKKKFRERERERDLSTKKNRKVNETRRLHGYTDSERSFILDISSVLSMSLFINY